MKEMFERVIALKNYDLKTLLANIDQYHIEGRLTDEERLDLTMQARKGAEPEYDYAGEINALWVAVRELQQTVKPPAEEDEAWPEFVQPTHAGTPTMWATRSPSRVSGTSACWPTAYGVRLTIPLDGRNRHKRLSEMAVVFICSKTKGGLYHERLFH